MNNTRFSFIHRLYFKISSAFALAIILVSALQFYFASLEYREIMSQVNQKLAWNTAALIANRIQADLLEEPTPQQFALSVLPYSEADPRLEFYLLTADGSIYADGRGGVPSTTKKIPLEPIRQALATETPPLPHRGAYPRDSQRLTRLSLLETNGRIFSVAPIYFNAEQGFLYVIIEGHRYTKAIRTLGQFFLTRIMSWTWLATFLGATLLAFLLFRYLSNRLRKISDVAEEYRSGNYQREISLQSSDELGMLAATLNEMARELIDAKQRSETQDTLRRNFIANITHDLRSPLQVALHNLERMKSNPTLTQNPTIIQDVEVVLDSVYLQNRLLDDLFELSALEAKEALPSLDAVKLRSMVELLLRKYQPVASEKAVTLEFSEEGEVGSVLADKLMLHRVFSNLIENALRFTPSGGMIRVTAVYLQDSATLSVADTGVGMTKEDAERAILRFSQGEKQAKDSTAHVGLGLAIVARILELHGSALSVQSGPEQGSVFSFELPIEDE